MSLRQRLYPDTAQAVGMVEHCQIARFMYNIALEQRSYWTRPRGSRAGFVRTNGKQAGQVSRPGVRLPKTPVPSMFSDPHGALIAWECELPVVLDAPSANVATQMLDLTELRGYLDWVRDGSTIVQQAALRDVDRAFSNFFDHRAGYPTFKKRTPREGSFAVRDLTLVRLNRKWATVHVPKIGPVRFRLSYAWADVLAATSARVTLRNGAWHVSFTTPPAERITAGTGAAVGIDRGVKNTAATSDGRMHHAPTLTAAERARFLKLHQHLSRQTRGSANRDKTLDEMATLRRRLDNRRRDWVEKTTTILARTYDLIAIEDLRTANMVRRPQPKLDPNSPVDPLTGQPVAYLPNSARSKSALNKLILGSLWGTFATRLGHKMLNGRLIKVDPRNTSRTCAACNHCAPGNRESQAVFECQSCGHQAHADTNAAINILNRAIASTCTTPHHTQPEDIGGSAAKQTTASRTAEQQPARDREDPGTRQPTAAQVGILVLQGVEDVKQRHLAV